MNGILATAQSLASKVANRRGRRSRLIRLLLPAYEGLLYAVSLGRGIAWPLNGVTYRVDPRHRRRIAPVYDPGAARYLATKVRPGEVCLNVGANVGVYVLQFATWSWPSGKVIAFEPNPVARAVLERHVRMNRLRDRVQVVPAAAGATDGEANFFWANADGRSRVARANPEVVGRSRSAPVPLVSLDSFCRKRGIEPNWIIIDVEGFEIAVLRGARQLLARDGRRPGVVVELHPAEWAGFGESSDSLASLLLEFGLRIEPLSGQHDPLREHGVVALVMRDQAAS